MLVYFWRFNLLLVIFPKITLFTAVRVFPFKVNTDPEQTVLPKFQEPLLCNVVNLLHNLLKRFACYVVNWRTTYKNKWVVWLFNGDGQDISHSVTCTHEYWFQFFVRFCILWHRKLALLVYTVKTLTPSCRRSGIWHNETTSSNRAQNVSYADFNQKVHVHQCFFHQ